MIVLRIVSFVKVLLSILMINANFFENVILINER